MVQRRCRLRDGIDSSVELQAACESMPTTPPRNPATQTCYLLCTLCTISHPPDFLSFHRLSFPLRQFSLWILRKIITSGRWGEEPADACAAALSRRGAGRLESALESAGVRAAPRRPTGIGTGIRGRARGAAPADCADLKLGNRIRLDDWHQGHTKEILDHLIVHIRHFCVIVNGGWSAVGLDARDAPADSSADSSRPARAARPRAHARGFQCRFQSAGAHARGFQCRFQSAGAGGAAPRARPRIPVRIPVGRRRASRAPRRTRPLVPPPIFRWLLFYAKSRGKTV